MRSLGGRRSSGGGSRCSSLVRTPLAPGQVPQTSLWGRILEGRWQRWESRVSIIDFISKWKYRGIAFQFTSLDFDIDFSLVALIRKSLENKLLVKESVDYEICTEGSAIRDSRLIRGFAKSLGRGRLRFVRQTRTDGLLNLYGIHVRSLIRHSSNEGKRGENERCGTNNLNSKNLYFSSINMFYLVLRKRAELFKCRERQTRYETFFVDKTKFHKPKLTEPSWKLEK